MRSDRALWLWNISYVSHTIFVPSSWRIFVYFSAIIQVPSRGSFIRCECLSFATTTTGGPSSSCEMIILRNNSHGGIIRVCMGIFTTALRNKKIRQILKKNTSPRFHSVLLVIWPLTLMKRAHLSELFISRFSTYIRKAQGWTHHFRTPDPRSEKSKLKMTGRPQICDYFRSHRKTLEGFIPVFNLVRFSDQAFGNGVFSLGLFLCTLKTSKWTTR